MSKRLGYHHVALRAQNMEETLKFYAALGCNVVRSWGEGDGQAAMLDVGGNNIIEVFAGGTPEAESKPRFEHIALRSDDVDGDYAQAMAAGATSHIEPKDVMLAGVMPIRIAFVIGPNQEVIEFFCEK